jgi:hypothetical protein
MYFFLVLSLLFLLSTRSFESYKKRAIQISMSLSDVFTYKCVASAIKQLRMYNGTANITAFNKRTIGGSYSTIPVFVVSNKKLLTGSLRSTFLNITIDIQRHYNFLHFKNLFSRIRGRNGFNSHPNITQVQSALRTVCIDNFFSSDRLLSPKSNCAATDSLHLVGLNELKGKSRI